VVREDGKRFLPPHPEKCQKQSDVTRGDRGGKVLVFDGYKYQKNRKRGDNIHWRCWRETCRAPLQTNDFNVDDKAPEFQRLSVTVEVSRVGIMIVGVISVGVMTVGVLSVGVMTLSH
jgi:hypothetical protein